MFNSIAFLVFLMIAPLIIFIYTFNFARWLGRRRERLASFTAYLLAFASVVTTGVVLWGIIV